MDGAWIIPTSQRAGWEIATALVFAVLVLLAVLRRTNPRQDRLYSWLAATATLAILLFSTLAYVAGRHSLPALVFLTASALIVLVCWLVYWEQSVSQILFSMSVALLGSIIYLGWFPVPWVETILKISVLPLPIIVAVVLGHAIILKKSPRLDILYLILGIVNGLGGFALPFLILWKGFQWDSWFAAIGAAIVFLITIFFIGGFISSRIDRR